MYITLLLFSARRGEPKCYNATEVSPSAGISLETEKGSSVVEVAVLSLPPQAAWAAHVLTAVEAHFPQDKGVYGKIIIGGFLTWVKIHSH